jgi:hypothetical protein
MWHAEKATIAPGRVTVLFTWMLWVHALTPSEGLDLWGPGGAVESLDECTQASVRAVESSVRKFREQGGDDTRFVVSGAVIDVTLPSGEKSSVAFVCLPDTVDPRGPTEK